MSTSNVDLGKMRVYYISNSRFKASLGLENQNDRMRIDCSADNPSKTLSYLKSSQIQSEKVHEIFDSVLDFYCEGLQNLSKGLRLGDEVGVFLNLSIQLKETAGEKYEVLKILDITFELSNGQKRLYKSEGGGGVAGDFISTEPLPGFAG
jgi:hypothetical protein